jgi:Icc-related predicted phosphoesterase
MVYCAVRLRVFSDLHTEREWVRLPFVEADVVVLAGDIGKGRRGVEWASRAFEGVPVVYVVGNHEYYGGSLGVTLDEMRAAASGTSVHVLERESLVIDDTRFLGTTLWTDFALHGPDHTWVSREYAARAVSDYSQINSAPGVDLRPEAIGREHTASREWLRTQLADRAEARRTVVVTHHAPSSRSLDPQDRDHALAPAYASRMDDLVSTSGAEAWIHGHIHRSADYALGGTRVFANPRGSASRLAKAFDATGLLVLE